MEIVKPKIDVAFKKIFTDKENRQLLRSFISTILDIDYSSIQDMVILNPEITPDEIGGKFTRFDIYMTVNDNHINIEIQISNAGDYKERSLYYWAKVYSEQLKKGEEYSDLKPTISINIVDFKLFETPDYHSKFTMMDKEHNIILTDKCEIHYFELSKIDRIPDTTDKKKLWMQLINAESEGELDMLAQTNVPEIIDGVTVVREFSKDERMRLLALSREKAIRDEISALGNARRKGLAEGRAEGRAEILEQLRSLGVDESILEKISS